MTTTTTNTIKNGRSTRMARPGAVLFAVGIFLLLGGATAWACAPSQTARAQPAQGPAGSTVTVSGAGFVAADGPVSIYFGGRSGALLGTATVDAAGNFSQAVTIPETAPGSYFLQAVQGPSRRANFPFEVTGTSAPAPPPPAPAPTPEPAPTPAPAPAPTTPEPAPTPAPTPAPDPGTNPQPPPVATQPIAPQPVEIAPQPEQQPVAPQPQSPPVAQQPVVLQPQPVAQQPVVPQPVAQLPGVQQQPVAPQPVAQQPVAQQPVASAPVVLQPVVVQPVIERLVPVGSPSPSVSGPQAAAPAGSATPAQPAATPTPATASTPSAGAGATDDAVAEAPAAEQETAVEPRPLTGDPDNFREVDAGGPSPWVLIPLAIMGLGVLVAGSIALAQEVRRTRVRVRS